MREWNAVVRCYRQRTTQVLRERSVSLPLWPPQVPYGMAWNWTGSSAVEARWLTACTVAWTESEINDGKLMSIFFFWLHSPPSGPGPPHWRGFWITQRRITVGRTPLDEGSARHRDLYLTTHNTHNRRNIHASGGIRTHNLSSRATSDLRLRSLGHWER